MKRVEADGKARHNSAHPFDKDESIYTLRLRATEIPFFSSFLEYPIDSLRVYLSQSSNLLNREDRRVGVVL